MDVRFFRHFYSRLRHDACDGDHHTLETILLGFGNRESNHLLLVDDHTDTVITLGALLRNLGYEVACAESVKQALQLVKESKFDLLVSDIGLPDGSGHDLMRQIRAQQSIAGIALSGFGMEDDLEKSRRGRIHRALNQAGERRSIASDAARDRTEQKVTT